MAPVGVHAAWALEKKADVVEKLLALKAKSGLTFDEIAEKCGVTNTYAAQLLLRQAHLKPGVAEKLKNVLRDLDEELVSAMEQPPMRSFDEDMKQDPTVYRLHEAVAHYGEGFKLLINEKFGDGIMSAIDFYCNLEKVKGKKGEDRVVIVFNGKFLPYVEQVAEDNTAVLAPASE